MTVTVFGHLVLISIDFTILLSSFFFFVLVSIEMRYQTLKALFDHIFKLEARQKYSALHCIFKSPLTAVFGMWSNTVLRVLYIMAYLLVYLNWSMISAVQIYHLSYIHLHSSPSTAILRKKLPVGLIAQLLEHCTSIAEIKGSNAVRAWTFFRL